MLDCGYTSYQDPRLQPPEEPEETAADFYESCVHAGACHRQLVKNGMWADDDGFGWVDRLAGTLGCKDCEEWSDR